MRRVFLEATFEYLAYHDDVGLFAEEGCFDGPMESAHFLCVVCEGRFPCEVGVKIHKTRFSLVDLQRCNERSRKNMKAVPKNLGFKKEDNSNSLEQGRGLLFKAVRPKR